jgi:uncharacterized protein (UPF0147 family)
LAAVEVEAQLFKAAVAVAQVAATAELISLLEELVEDPAVPAATAGCITPVKARLLDLAVVVVE